MGFDIDEIICELNNTHDASDDKLKFLPRFGMRFFLSETAVMTGFLPQPTV